jgi:hypothetical protein
VKRLAPGLLAALLFGCSAPDYTPVRDWARTASLAADHPAAETAQDGAAAMRQALATWLAALGRMADDGVLPYPEDPFAELAPRARQADAAGGEAVAALGALLRRATRQNWRAPQVRGAIAEADPHVQALVGALLRTAGGTPHAALVERIGADHARLKARARDITDDETVAGIRAAEDRLRRAAFALPRPAAQGAAVP